MKVNILERPKVLIFLTAGLLSIPLVAFVVRFFLVPVSDDSEQWAEFGSYFGGTLGPILGFASIVLLVITINQQRDAMRLQAELSSRDALESAIFRLYDRNVEMRQKLDNRIGANGKVAPYAFEAISAPLRHPDDKIVSAVNSQFTGTLRNELTTRFRGLELGKEARDYFSLTAQLVRAVHFLQARHGRDSSIVGDLLQSHFDNDDRKLLLLLVVAESDPGKILKEPLQALRLLPEFQSQNEVTRLTLIAAYGPGIVPDELTKEYRYAMDI